MQGMKTSSFKVLTDSKTRLKYVAKCEDEPTKNHNSNDRESISCVNYLTPYCLVKS